MPYVDKVSSMQGKENVKKIKSVLSRTVLDSAFPAPPTPTPLFRVSELPQKSLANFAEMYKYDFCSKIIVK